jgi:hypothetical protein
MKSFGFTTLPQALLYSTGTCMNQTREVSYFKANGNFGEQFAHEFVNLGLYDSDMSGLFEDGL